MTAPGKPQPRRSSPAVKRRPIRGCTPSTRKKSPLTKRPWARRASPPGERSKPLLAQASTPENASWLSRNRSQIGLVRAGYHVAWLPPPSGSVRQLDQRESLRILHRNRAQAHCIEQLENRGVGADAEGQRQNGHCREPRAPAQHAAGEAQIGDQVLERAHPARVAAPLPAP